MNELPKVYANPIDHDINNEQKYYRSDTVYNGISINDIDKALKNSDYIYRVRVKMLIGGEYVIKIIIKRVNDYLLTIDNEKIPIKEIKSFEVI